MRVVGKRTSRPSIAMFGVVCVTLCIVMRYAARIAGSRLGQSVGFSWSGKSVSAVDVAIVSGPVSREDKRMKLSSDGVMG